MGEEEGEENNLLFVFVHMALANNVDGLTTVYFVLGTPKSVRLATLSMNLKICQ